ALRLLPGPRMAFVVPTASRSSSLPIDEDVALISRSGLFDRQHYSAQASEVGERGLDPIAHYLARGAAEGLDPHPLFDSSFYREQNPDLPADVNPLVHYLRNGAAEGRDPHPLFDSSFYREQNPHVAADVNRPVHHLLTAAPERPDPHPPVAPPV